MKVFAVEDYSPQERFAPREIAWFLSSEDADFFADRLSQWYNATKFRRAGVREIEVSGGKE